MNSPEVLWSHVRHIDFQGSDRHKIAKELTAVFAELIQFANGDCPHRPEAVMILEGQQSGSKSTLCVYCSQEIEIKKIQWGLKGRFPLAPKSA